MSCVVAYLSPGAFQQVQTWFDDAGEAQDFYEAKRRECERVVLFDVPEPCDVGPWRPNTRSVDQNPTGVIYGPQNGTQQIGGAA